MTCLTCAHATLRDANDSKRDQILRSLARHGFANCTLTPFRATFHAFEHTCPKFVEAEAKVAAARRAWATKNLTTEPA